MKSRVLIISKNARFDHRRNLEPFGECVFVFDKRTPSLFSTEEFVEGIREELKKLKYDPDVDYIAFSGSVIAVALFYGTVMDEYGTARCLLFDANRDEYCERVIESIWDEEEV